jgi:hypothetical protein
MGSGCEGEPRLREIQELEGRLSAEYSAAVGELARREKELATLKARSAGRRKAHLAVLADRAVNRAATTNCCDTQVRPRRAIVWTAAGQPNRNYAVGQQAADLLAEGVGPQTALGRAAAAHAV